MYPNIEMQKQEANQIPLPGYPPDSTHPPGYPPYPTNPPGYLPNPTNPPGYPPNPTNPPGYPPNPTNPPGYYPNPSGQSGYFPNVVPGYNNVPPPYPYGSSNQPAFIVTSQPNVMVLPQPACRDYMAWSIVNLIFSNLILGIVAVIFSSKTRNAFRCGDSCSAFRYSRTAFTVNMLAAVLGFISHCGWIIWVIYSSVSNNTSSYYYYNYGFS